MAPKKKSVTKIVRSRTEKKKLTQFQENFAPILREIRDQQPLALDGVSSATCNPTPSSSTTNGRGKTRAGRGKFKATRGKSGQRVGDIGGGPLATSFTIDDGSLNASAANRVLQRSFGQTCQPVAKDKSHQTLACEICNNMGHAAHSCSPDNVLNQSRRPAALNCHQCKLTYKYTSSKHMSIDVELCSGHRNTSLDEDHKRKKDAAVFMLDKIHEMRNAGVPLHTAISIMGMDIEQYNTLRIIADN